MFNKFWGKDKLAIPSKDEIMFDNLLNHTSRMIEEAKNDSMNLVFALAMATKTKPKDMIKFYDEESLNKYSESLLVEVNKQIDIERKKAQKKLDKITAEINKRVASRRAGNTTTQKSAKRK